jgi:hypothetical protein
MDSLAQEIEVWSLLSAFNLTSLLRFDWRVRQKMVGSQTSFQMDVRSTHHTPVYKDLLTFALDDRPVEYDEQRPIYIDAENPSWALNARQFRMLVRSLIAGLRHAADLREAECVLVHLPNNVRE